MPPVEEAQPFKTLQELYDNVGNLKPWPSIRRLRESTDYVYRGSEVISQKVQLEKIDRQDQPRTLVCHDMKGGYLEDRFINGSRACESYLFYNWSVVDTFVYFSHHFVTIPPFGWINAAHDHGVKVLGTVITEREGIWDPILKSQEEARRFADALILVTKFYEFDGWLLNVENVIQREQINNLLYFVKYLTENIHEAIRDSEIIWYDSVTNEGILNWQNELNDKNVDFFLNCDGIYLNYNWTKTKLENSRELAKSHNRSVYEVYAGVDVWGRGCPGGGGFNSKYALEKIRQEELSVAIFGQAWTHEYFGPKLLYTLEETFWAELFPYLYVHVPIYEEETFKTSFCRGSADAYFHCGKLEYEMRDADGLTLYVEKQFYDLSRQKPQISVPIPYSTLTSRPETPEPKSDDDRNECSLMPIYNPSIYETRKYVITVFNKVAMLRMKSPIQDANYFQYRRNVSFEGGGCLKLITNELSTYHRLFLVHVEFERDIEATIVYKEIESVEANGTRSEPVLVLGNDTGLRSIVPHRSESHLDNWKKCFYLTNVRTVNEIGVSSARKNVFYLGEIGLEQKRRHQNDRTDSTDCVNRINESSV